MKLHWFARWGWVFRPVSLAGVVIVLGALAFCAQVFVAIDRHSHSATDTLFGVFPYFVCVFTVVQWIASNTSREEAKAG